MQFGNLRSLKDPLSNYRVNLIRGLHPEAQFGEISSLTGIDSDHERHKHPEIVLNSTEYKVEELTGAVLAALRQRD